MHPGDHEILDSFAGRREATIQLVRRLPGDWLGRSLEGHDATWGWGFRHIADDLSPVPGRATCAGV